MSTDGIDNFHAAPPRVTNSREREERNSMAHTIKAAQEIREKYRDVPVAIKMSRETWRRLVIAGNIQPGKEPTTHFMAMPIVFDEELPVGEVKEQFR